MRYLTVFFCLFSLQLAYSIIPAEQLKNYPNTYFVETGTLDGNGLFVAAEAGFTHLRSIEALPNPYRGAVKRTKNLPNVRIWLGNSATDLWDMIQDIDEPITFWLDAHIYPAKKNVQNCPLKEELAQIAQHPIKTHTILIDDMICAGTAAFDYLTRKDIEGFILAINPDYQISYVDHGNDPKNLKDYVLVAVPPKE